MRYYEIIKENDPSEDGSVIDLGKRRLIKKIEKSIQSLKSGEHQEMMDRRAFELHKTGHLPLPVGTRVIPPKSWEMHGRWNIHGYWQDILKPEEYGYKLKNDSGDEYNVHNVRTHTDPHIFGGGFRAFTGPQHSNIKYTLRQNPVKKEKTSAEKDKIDAEYNDLFGLRESDSEHSETLRDTGFWGRAGAGCIFISRDTGKILLNHRSNYVEQPNTWGVWGGAIDGRESPLQAVKREAYEESGQRISDDQIIPIYVFHDTRSGFKYYNFIVVVESEFNPKIPAASQWETRGWRWVEFGDWPTPLHFGVTAILNDANSVKIIKNLIDNGETQ